MNKKVAILYILFIAVLLEISGCALMRQFSKGSDFTGNRHYNKIREMLLADHGKETVSKYIEVPYLAYIPNPGYTREGYLQHNVSGYRGEDVPLKKSTKYRILCLGGSTTYGTGVNDPQDTYPAQLKKILDESGQFTQGVEVINAGVEAATSAEELNYYNHKFRYYQPDLVIIHSGGNDALVFTDNADYQLDYSHYRKMSFHLESAPEGIKWTLHSNFVSFCLIHFIYAPMLYSSKDMFSNQGVQSLRIAHWTDKKLLKTNDSLSFFYNAFYQNHKQLIQNIQRDKAKVLNVSFAYNEQYYTEHKMNKVRSNVDANNELIERVCKETGAQLVAYSYSSISREKYWKDDCHLSKEGEREKALLISEYILNQMVYE